MQHLSLLLASGVDKKEWNESQQTKRNSGNKAMLTTQTARERDRTCHIYKHRHRNDCKFDDGDNIC